MKYRIIGADGKMYGPAGLEQIRQWLAEGRADNRTPVYAEGARDWTYLGLLPELAAQFAAPPPARIAAPPGVTPARGTNGFATAGLVCALLSWIGCCCCCGLPFSLLGLLFSIIALVQINSQPQPQEGRLFAILGLALSAANLLAGLAALALQLVTGATKINWQMTGFQ
jgi:hypothetical protein